MSAVTENEQTSPDNQEPLAQDTAQSTFSQDDLRTAVESARQQEKDKLYSRLSDMDASRSEMERMLKEQSDQLKILVEERNAAQEALEAKRIESLSAEERVAERLSVLETREAELQAQLIRVAEEAANRVRESELKVYRANKIAESGITLTELVNGSSEAEIDAAIVTAKQREDAIFRKAEERVRADMQAQLPRPSPAPQPAQQTTQQLVNPRDKYKLAEMNPADFQKLRDELLAQARQQTGRT